MISIMRHLPYLHFILMCGVLAVSQITDLEFGKAVCLERSVSVYVLEHASYDNGLLQKSAR